MSNVTIDSGSSSDLVRLSKSKKAVDLCPNAVRGFAKRGLKLYRAGRAVFFSRTELENFIKHNSTAPAQKAKVAA